MPLICRVLACLRWREDKPTHGADTLERPTALPAASD